VKSQRRIVAQDFSINDYGCGYGALVQYLVKHDYKFASYTGFEITQAMSDKARERKPQKL